MLVMLVWILLLFALVAIMALSNEFLSIEFMLNAVSMIRFFIIPVFYSAAEDLRNEIGNITEQIYFSSWTNLNCSGANAVKSRELRSLLLMVMIRANHEECLTAGGFAKICLQTLVKVNCPIDIVEKSSIGSL